MDYNVVFKNDELLYYTLQAFYKHLDNKFKLNLSDELRIIFGNIQKFIINDDIYKTKVLCFDEDGINLETDEKDIFIKYNFINSFYLIMADWNITLWEE